MSVRNFDPGDLVDVLDGGFPDPSTTAFTLLALIRPDTVAGGDRPCMGVGHSGGDIIMACNGNGGAYADDDNFEGSAAALGMTTTDWWIFAMGKSTGTGVARFHAVILGGGSPVHSNSSASVTADSFTPDRFVFGHYIGGAENFDAKLAVTAAFLTNLSDGDVESIATTASSVFLQSLGAHEIWEWNQASTATNVVGLLGTGADQNVLSGTDVQEGVDPAWTFGLGEDAEPGSRYVRVVGPAQLGTVAADLYTVPDNATVQLRSVYVNNPTGSEIEVTLSIGADAAGTRILDQWPIPAGESRQGRRATNHTLEGGETLQGFCDTASAAVLQIDGHLEAT